MLLLSLDVLIFYFNMVFDDVVFIDAMNTAINPESD